jgi:hypothetical protein
MLGGEHCRAAAPRSRPAATIEEIVAALRAWNAEHGAPPRQHDWSNASAVWRDAWPRWPGATTVMRVVGSWNAALEAARLPTHRYADALERLAAWARVHGRPPTIADARADPGLPGPQTCQQLYGSWNAPLRAAKLAPGYEARWSDEHVPAILAEWARWNTRHAGGEPSAASYRHWAARQGAAVPSASSIRRRFAGGEAAIPSDRRCAPARGIAAAIWSPRRSGCCTLRASCCPARARRVAGRSPSPEGQSPRRPAARPAAVPASAAHTAVPRARADRARVGIVWTRPPQERNRSGGRRVCLKESLCLQGILQCAA